jgi:hypothetical protein
MQLALFRELHAVRAVIESLYKAKGMILMEFSGVLMTIMVVFVLADTMAVKKL